MPCSAAEVQYASTALTCCGSGSPRQRIMKRSTTDSRLVDLLLRDHRQALAARGLGDVRQRHHGGAREVVAGLSPRRCPAAASDPTPGASIASADCTSTRMSPECTGIGNGSAGGRPGLKAPSTSRPQTFPKETWPDQVLDVDAAVAERAAFLVGFGDLRLERDDSFESGYEVGHQAAPHDGCDSGLPGFATGCGCRVGRSSRCGPGDAPRGCWSRDASGTADDIPVLYGGHSGPAGLAVTPMPGKRDIRHTARRDAALRARRTWPGAR